MTPAAAPSSPAGASGAPDLIIWATMLWLLALSIALPAALGGGWLWLLTAAMVPLIAGWAVLQRLMVTRRDHLQLQGSGPIVAIVLCTAVAVAAFCAVVAFAFEH